MEKEVKEKKKVNVKLIVYIIAPIFIVIGILLAIIPSLVTPNYRLYKGGEDVTYKYLNQNYDESCYKVDGALVENVASDPNTFINVNTSELIADNSAIISPLSKVMIKMNFTIDLEDYDSVSYEVIQNDLKVVIKDESGNNHYSYTVNSINPTSLKSGEIIVDLNNVVDYKVGMEGKISIVRKDNNEETKDLSLSLDSSSFYLEFYKE